MMLNFVTKMKKWNLDSYDFRFYYLFLPIFLFSMAVYISRSCYNVSQQTRKFLINENSYRIENFVVALKPNRTTNDYSKESSRFSTCILTMFFLVSSFHVQFVFLFVKRSFLVTKKRSPLSLRYYGWVSLSCESISVFLQACTWVDLLSGKFGLR